MKWYYAEAGRQVGPIAEEELLRLAESGKIQADTLVWHEGLAAWQVYGYVRPEPAIRPPVLTASAAPSAQADTSQTPSRPQPALAVQTSAKHGQTVCCTKCHAPVPGFILNQGAAAACPGCNALLQVEVFPALFKQIVEGKSGETILVEGEAGCFYHPQKRAVIPCSLCGRFLCALCDVELNDQHLCPVCLDTGRKKGKLTQLENKRALYDSSALMLALAPLLCFWPISCVTAPAAVVLAIYSWSQPPSILPRTRIRSYLAIGFGVLEIAGWILALAGVFKFVNFRIPHA